MYGINQYRSYQTEAIGPEDAVAVCYDGARRFVDQALLALEDRDFEKVNLYTSKAQRVLSELAAALDFEAGGEIATNLAKLYDYWIWRLSQGLIKQDPEAFREVSGVLMEMHEAWVEAAKQVRAKRGAVSVG